MARSYLKIDYRLRPAKHVERLMMCDAFRRLRFGSVGSYQYVGLGSVYFSDFVTFHRALGVTRMCSIEGGGGHDRQRFLDNRPFAGIEMLWGRTATELSKIDFGLRTIAWLDYDGRLTRSVLDDVGTLATRMCNGSLFAVSVQCAPVKPDLEHPRRNVDALAQELGAGNVDPALDDEALLGWGAADVFKDAIDLEIGFALAARNATRPVDQRIEYRPIFNFRYKDGAHMLTVGGVLVDAGQKQLYDLCGFGELDFVRTSSEPFMIEIPQLTSRELRMLDAQMPAAPAALDHGSMPRAEAERFSRIYRYMPHYIPAEML